MHLWTALLKRRVTTLTKSKAKGELELFGDWCRDNGIYAGEAVNWINDLRDPVSDYIKAYKEDLRRGSWPNGSR